jgi:outer membrane protein
MSFHQGNPRRSGHSLPFIFIGFALLAAAAAAVPAMAQTAGAADDAAAQNSSASHWGLGLAASVERSPYRDYGNKTRVLPLITYDGPRFRLQGTTADLKLGSLSSVDFSLRAKYSGEGYSSGDAAILNGMEDRKSSFWAGGAAIWRSPLARISLEWLGDVSGNSSGQTLRLGAERGFSFGKARLTPHLGASWLSSNYTDYYYGVRQSEATSARRAYSAGSTVNLTAGLRVDYALTASQSLIMDASVTRYGSAISDSPLVDRSSSPALRLGYLYKF